MAEEGHLFRLDALSFGTGTAQRSIGGAVPTEGITTWTNAAPGPWRNIMFHPRIPAALLLFSVAHFAQAQAPIEKSIHFNTASADLDAASVARIRSVCADLGDRLPTSITLTGHTDDRGSEAYNAALSERRADAVRELLRETCPDLAGADIAWKGEQRPVADNTSDSGRALNRRVDIVLSFTDEPMPDEAATGQMRAYPTIEPLLPLVDKQREHFTVNASKAIDIRTEEGWTVHIDGGSIVDALGNPVSGPVDVTCRAFFTPGEMIASGIPMFVGHGDDAGHMESAGMYEVLATKDGQPLRLAPGRDITVQREMAAIPGPGYNNYMLDPESGQWEEESDYSAPPETPLQDFTTALIMQAPEIPLEDGYTDSLAAWWTYEQELRGVPRMPDTLSFKARQLNRNYCLTTRCAPMRDEKGAWKGRVFEMDRTGTVPQISLRTGRKRSASPGRICFQVKLAKGWLHPEWSVFGEEKYWVYAGPMGREKWLDSIASKHLYQDIELIAQPGSDEGSLRLKSQGAWIELPLDLSTYGHTNADDPAWTRQLSTFHKRAANRAKQFDNHLRSSTEAVKRRIERQEASAYMIARRKMRDDEKVMEKAEWIKASQEQCASVQARAAADMRARMLASDPLWDERVKAQAVTASFTMSGFGIYNCDQILERRAIEPMVIAVVDENAEPFKWHTAYGVMDGRNAVITYWGNGTGMNDRMRLSKDMTSLVLVGRDNELLVVERPGTQCAGKASARMQGTRAAQPATPQELEALVMR